MDRPGTSLAAFLLGEEETLNNTHESDDSVHGKHFSASRLGQDGLWHPCPLVFTGPPKGRQGRL